MVVCKSLKSLSGWGVDGPTNYLLPPNLSGIGLKQYNTMFAKEKKQYETIAACEGMGGKYE